MVSVIASLLSSAGFGSIIGTLGGLFNRWLDLRQKDKELEAQKVKNAHDLAMRDKDREEMALEWQHREQIVSIETAGRVDEKAYDAMIASYANDKATYGIRFVDMVRGLTRPVLTSVLTLGALAVNGILIYLLTEYWHDVPIEDRLKLIFMALEWLLFQAGTVIGWWFGVSAKFAWQGRGR